MLQVDTTLGVWIEDNAPEVCSKNLVPADIDAKACKSSSPGIQ